MPTFKTRELTDLIVVHCADTYDHMDIGAEDIDRWHRGRGWLSIGYHFVIRRDGTVEPGRPPHVQGAHVQGHNDCSIGICMIGGRGPNKEPEDNFTYEQEVSLKTLLETLRCFYPEAEIAGHYQLDSGKACPSFNVPEALEGWGIEADPE